MPNNKEGEDIKLTISKNAQYTYAILTKKMKEVRITTIVPPKGTQVYMLGVKKALSWKHEKDGIVIQLPEDLPCEHAWVLKIENRLSQR
jgi:cell division protein FtsI/penicillin-binding protein 2